MLFQIPQRYRFSSKSQQSAASNAASPCCFRYHKGTDFQANHNLIVGILTKLMLFQIPQRYRFSSKSQHEVVKYGILNPLFQIPQRYRFSSKSQHRLRNVLTCSRCFRYHKGTDFQANHNKKIAYESSNRVVLDTTKVQIFKQITTNSLILN